MKAPASFNSLPCTLQGNRNGGLSQIAETYTQQPLEVDDGPWNDSWEELLSLMQAPSAVPENFMAYNTMRATNENHVLIQNSGNQSAYSSYSQGSNNLMQMQTMMNVPAMSANNSLPYSLQEGFPVCYDLNHSYADASSSITSSSQFAPQTPQLVKRSQQYSAAMNLSLDQSLNQYTVLHDDLTASSITQSSQFAPATPQLTKAADNCSYLATQSLSIDQIQNQDKVQQDIIPISIENESTRNDCQELLPDILESTSTAIGSSLKEGNGSEIVENQNIDLNKTPPMKTPRRKKYMPKVIRENKPPRGRKPAKEKLGPDGTPVPKRKYVRKSKINAVKTPEKDVGEKTKDSTTEPASKSCRRSLHFEMEDNITDTIKEVHQQEKQCQTQENIFQNGISQEAGFPVGSNHSTGTNSAQQSSQSYVQIQGNKGGITTSFHPSVHQLQKVDTHQFNQHVFETNPVTRDQQTDKLYTSTSKEVTGATVLRKKTVNGYQIPGYHPLFAGAGQSLQEITAQEKLDRIRQTIEQIQQKRVSQYIQSRGSKRDYALTKEHEGFVNSTNTANSQLCQEIFQNEHMRTKSRLDQCYSGTQKRNRIEKLNHIANSSIQNSARFADNRPHIANSSIQNSARFADNRSSRVQMNGYAVNHFQEVNGGLLNSFHRSNASAELNPDPASPCMNLFGQPIFPKASLGQEKVAEKEARISALAHVIHSANSLAYPNMQNHMPPNNVNSRTRSLVNEKTIKSNHAIVPIKKKNGASILPKPIAILSKPVANITGKLLKQKNTVSVDDITDQLKCLNLNSRGNEMVIYEQNALVLYKGDGTLVPYQGLDPLKRRKPRPKVDLDPETNRLWNLLMGKEVSDEEKQTDEQKTKWWEEQREVFRGRADSFIARMHLVQGDRRFSPWKGSVVDSVIGVFLTQNVTDHLSSSAFMSLAAQFPPQSISRNIASSINKPDALAEESQICIVETNDNMQGNEKFKNQVIYDRIPNEPLDQRISLDELVSSQDSAESSIVHMNGLVRPLYMSGLTADRPTNGCQSISRYSTMSFIIEEMENLDRFPNFTCQDSGSLYYKTGIDGHMQPQNKEASEQKKLDGTYPFDLNTPQFLSPHISSSSCQLPAAGGLGLSDTDGCNTLRSQHYMSLHSTSVSKDMGVTSTGTEKDAQGKAGSIHNEKMWPKELPTENTLQNYHQQSSCCDNQQDRTMSTHFGRQSDKGPFHQQHKMVEDATVYNLPGDASSAQKSISAAKGASRTKTNVSKEKGRKAQGVKNSTVDWDCLRRQVKQRERNQNTMDSIDYEALQRADVSKISDIIRERGMNNMLADRIKDFLNRLVRDHGSIDLEWLRDAPSDKAKDYLLSVRGLGLKSVECIRLLTLHQHAFPVDTNVGRIAVRLGWVPLQPLPESLQLHLLELYPMLESIQKYLYPRLCNLDQPTLYELHYQLITFGKVFCTKTKPNCNACPMRGECRHFASAFASSRLALPGPEEKSIVPSQSHSPIDTSRNPAIGVGPLPLQSLQDAKPEDTAIVHRTCEPIVEEPTTPEPESTEISEIVDIEEAFYDDSEEIPMIRLNAEEFNKNLQNFMQNLALQDGDMSKALVAFDPKVASIPTPKLKNVSRLRTEHQVYQLPDSHPLLKELDKREPDDPSPYLLAIWTPGETANSIQPPEGICNFQVSGQLCCEKACFTCNSVRESNAQTVRGTLLIPCRTAMRGSFPLNGTYFQVNEVFADHESSLEPFDVPREWIWNLPRRTVYFGTSVSAIFRGMSTEEIQHCFWRGFVCVRGFDQKSRIPRPLMARLHFSASKQLREADKRSRKRQNN